MPDTINPTSANPLPVRRLQPGHVLAIKLITNSFLDQIAPRLDLHDPNSMSSPVINLHHTYRIERLTRPQHSTVVHKRKTGHVLIIDRTRCEGERRYRTLISLLGFVSPHAPSGFMSCATEGFPGYSAGRGADPARGAPEGAGRGADPARGAPGGG
ncbi:hypothetical protein F511_35892 [Dorcoceras hygrometricum]|uniref:Uncharacterized protein n=1 Tax=Dorcoceras hygrometricum TaxID=472368 RepID=A0A2Z7CTD9_9LAMI|nr:hypothetical protein F511_35892 [Dorcoceras hygrometricum]